MPKLFCLYPFAYNLLGVFITHFIYWLCLVLFCVRWKKYAQVLVSRSNISRNFTAKGLKYKTRCYVCFGENKLSLFENIKQKRDKYYYIQNETSCTRYYLWNKQTLALLNKYRYPCDIGGYNRGGGYTGEFTIIEFWKKDLHGEQLEIREQIWNSRSFWFIHIFNTG